MFMCTHKLKVILLNGIKEENDNNERNVKRSDEKRMKRKAKNTQSPAAETHIKNTQSQYIC